ncbi:MAG TPA: SseB family protein [Thermopolyspora sp.]
MPNIPHPVMPDDDGSADPALAAALAAFGEGTAGGEPGGGVAEVVTALSTARLLVPVVAVLTESEVGEHGVRQEKLSDMALPKLIGKDGRAAVLAFTGVASLKRWRPDARPIQIRTPQVCQAALHENAAAVVIDVAGPVPFPVEDALLHALAALDAPPDEVLERMTRAGPDITVARLQAGPKPRRRFPWSRGARG